MLPAEAAEAIRSMRVRGAGLIARTAAGALGEWAAAYRGASFADDLRRQGELLVATRPTAVSLRNAVRHVVSASRTPLEAEKAATAFVAESERAVERIAMLVARDLRDGARVLTHCNSQAALAGILRAHAEGKRVHVVATESRPWRQGLLTARQLAEAGVSVVLIVDAAVATALHTVDRVLVGADTVARNGDVVNKIGTALVAIAARDAGVPVTVCAETYKIDRDAATGADVVIEERDVEEVVEADAFPGVAIENPVFDVTPARLVDRIVTERGPVRPADIAGLLP